MKCKRRQATDFHPQVSGDLPASSYKANDGAQNLPAGREADEAEKTDILMILAD
jgi:hypothetical protein